MDFSTSSQVENCWLSSILPSNCCHLKKFSGISNLLKGNFFVEKVSQLFMLVTKLVKEMVKRFCTIYWIMHFDQVFNGNFLIFGVVSC